MTEPHAMTSSAAMTSAAGAATSAGALSSAAPALLSPTALSVAAQIVERVAVAEKRRQRWWWMTLFVQTAVGFVLVNKVPPDIEALWSLGFFFVGTTVFHLVSGLLTRARLGLDAQREVLDVGGLLEAIHAVRRQGLTVEQAVERTDQVRGLRAR